ncbi:MAG: OmpA/MotB family protein [Planctomycetota bacterium]
MRRVRYLACFAALTLIAAGCVSTDWEARYLEKEMESRALQEQYDSMNQALAEREAAADLMQDELDRTRDEVRVLSSQVVDLERKKTEAPAPAAPAAEARPYMREFEDIERQYPGSVRRTADGNIEITLSSDITFASGSYTLTAQGKQVLDLVAMKLTSEFAANQIRVIGHTDSDPIKRSPFKDNWELGAERASEVVRYFAKKHGVAKSRLEAMSRGDTAPIADNKTVEGKKKNRRVEIVVVLPRR